MLLFPRPGDNVVSARARSSQETLMSCFIDHSAGHKKPRLFYELKMSPRICPCCLQYVHLNLYAANVFPREAS